MDELGTRTFLVHPDDRGRRLDRVLRKLLPRASLDRIYKALRRGDVVVDGVRRDPSYRVGVGERIGLGSSLAALASPAPPAARGVRAVDADARELVLYRCAHFVVLDKPWGLPVHGEESLATRVEALLSNLSEPSLSFRPGPVHRLDRDTTGVILFALTLTGAQTLSAYLRDRACEKTYLALLEGVIEEPRRWVDRIRRDRSAYRTVEDPEGDHAVTLVQPLCAGPACTLSRVQIETGRTHQIRAQASMRGHPLAGDARYGGGADPEGYVLHSARFRLPPGGGLSDRTVFEAPLPARSRSILERRLGREAVERALASFGEDGGGAPPC